MVVHDLDGKGVVIDPPETDAPLVVDPNNLLRSPVTSCNLQIAKAAGGFGSHPYRHPRQRLAESIELRHLPPFPCAVQDGSGATLV